MKLTLRDVAEDALTAARLRPGETDMARGGGLRAGHYRIGSDGTLELHGVAFVPGVTRHGADRGSASAASAAGCGSAGAAPRMAC